MQNFVSLTSDFGVQSQSVGIMEATVRMLAPHAHVIHLMHGLPEYDLTAAARTLEAISYMPVGAHVCICDPGVGSARRAIAIQVGRGDYLIGPDNGVLLPAADLLGGICAVHELTNSKYMRHPVAKIFHGRDIFSPAAAYLASGISIAEFGDAIEVTSLANAPYTEAAYADGIFDCKIIQINRFGSLHLNILHSDWDRQVPDGQAVAHLMLENGSEIKLAITETFSDVDLGEPLILKDDYGRVEVALNRESFSRKYECKIGSTIKVKVRD